MILPVKLAYDVFKADDFYKNIEVFMYDVPENYQKFEDLPIIRITEIHNKPTLMASNIPHTIYSIVQIDVWAETLMDLEFHYIKINKLFIKNGWSTQIIGTDKDKDFNNTPRIYFRFSKRQNISFV